MIVRVNQKTTKELGEIAKKYNLQVEVVDDQDYKFQEEVIRSKRLVKVRSFIDPEHFDYLFRQIGQSYQIDHDQGMFVFNLFHGIGHFELNLWKKQYDDPIVGRLENLEHDKKVNDWAYKKFREWEERSS